MAVAVLTDAYVLLNSVDLSDHVRSVELTVDISEEDASAMGASGFSSTLAGLKSGTINLEVNQDYAASKVDATMWPLLGSSFAFEIRPTTSAVGPTNPKFTGSASLFTYSPINGSVGATNTTTITLKAQGAITRATS